MTRADLEQAVRAFVIAATGLDDDRVLLAPINGPRPASVYATVQVTSTPANGHDEERTTSTVADEDDDTFVVDRVGQRRAMVDVNVYGPDSLELAELVRDATGSSTTRAVALAEGIAVVGAGDVRAIPRLLDTEHEERALVEIEVAWVRESAGAGLAVATVRAELDVLGGDDVIDTVEAEAP